MSFRARLLLPVVATVAAACVAGLPRAASAQRAPAPVPAANGGGRGAAANAAPAALLAERQRLRGELGRVQAEIDRLKASDRGLRDDYRLRARMADAEALARRLTAIDAQLGAAPPAPRPQPGIEPGASPSDGPAELEAKADILSDEARRVQLQIDALRARGEQLRGREELRRRSGQLERDPFAPLEGSKRRVVTGTGSASASSPPRSSGSVASPSDHVAGAMATPTTPPPSLGGPASGPSASVRDLVDADTLAEIRRLEQNGSPASSLEAIDRAVKALDAKARRLDAQSKALRDRARAGAGR
jgi:hypothetical protein